MILFLCLFTILHSLDKSWAYSDLADVENGMFHTARSRRCFTVQWSEFRAFTWYCTPGASYFVGCSNSFREFAGICSDGCWRQYSVYGMCCSELHLFQTHCSNCRSYVCSKYDVWLISLATACIGPVQERWTLLLKIFGLMTTRKTTQHSTGILCRVLGKT